jgi:hypothetical protein
MGKAGEKQKRKPKIKDKRQSERFKETGREVGADESSDALGPLIDELAKMTEKPASLPKMPAATKLGRINSGGIVDVGGSYWRIAPLDLSRARSWGEGAPVILSQNDPGKVWTFRLTAENGEEIGLLPSRRPPK